MLSYVSFPSFMMSLDFDYCSLGEGNSRTCLSRLAFVNIFGCYWRGRYGENEIIVRQGDCYVNATKLCQQFGKHFEDWKLQAEKLIAWVEAEMKDEQLLFYPFMPMNFTSCEIVNDCRSSGDLAGVYVHPYLLPHLFMWLKKDFAILAAKLLNQHMTDNYMESFETIRAAQYAVKKEVVVSDDKLTAKTKKRNDIRKIVNDSHSFTILDINSEVELPYYVIRCKRRAMRPSIRKIKKRHPKATVIYMQEYVSNKYNLFVALKNEEKLKSRLNYFNIDASRCELVDKIRKLSQPLESSLNCGSELDELYILDKVAFQ